MSDRAKQSRLNIKSYLANSIFFLPAISFGITLGNAHSESDFTQSMQGVARIVSLIFVVIYIRFTYRRLHDANRNGRFSFALIPPFTIFLLIYLLTASNPEPGKWGEPVKGLTMFGIRAKGWRIIGIVLVAIIMIYITALFASFLFDSGTTI